MTSYCTLQGARRQLMVQNETINQEQCSDLAYYAMVAAASIDDWTGSWFDERVLTLGFSGAVGKYNPDLYLKELPLVAVDTLANGNGDVLTSGNYTLLPTGGWPKAKIRLARGYFWRGPSDPANSTATGWCCPQNMTPMLNVAYAEDAIQIAGRWGYHRQYPRAWRRITLTVDTAIDDMDTTLVLSNAIGTAFDVGNILQIVTGSASEQLLVTGPIADSAPSGFATDTITVERGYNGTTAIGHDAGNVINVWQPETMIVNVAEMIVAAFYKGRSNPTGDTQVIAEFGKMVIPVDIPAKAKRALVPYRSWRRGRP